VDGREDPLALTVDSAEKSALTSIAAGCTNVTITVTQAI
jgi:hypothetical protein